MKKSILATALVIGFSAPAFALEGTPGEMYGGVSYSIGNVSYDDQVVSGNTFSVDDFSLSLINFNLGVYLHKNFSLEGRFGFGVGDDTSDINVNGVDSGYNMTLSADSTFGVYGVGHVNLNNSAGAYFLAGWSRVNGTASVETLNISSSGDDSGFSFGGGVEYAFSPKTSVKAEYMSYLRGSDYDVNTFSIGINQRF